MATAIETASNLQLGEPATLPEETSHTEPVDGELPANGASAAYEILSSDLATYDRRHLASAGERLDPGLLERMAAGAKPSDSARVPLSRSGVLEDIKGFLSRPTYHHLFGKVRRQFELFSLIRETTLPQLLAGELSFLRRTAPLAGGKAPLPAGGAGP